MGDYYIGEIRLFPYNKIPRDWHVCDGSLLTIQTNAALYSLLGISFGGDGRTNFALPNLQGRVVVGAYDPNHNVPVTIGGLGGQDLVILTEAQIPPHSHLVNGVAAAATSGTSPVGAYIAQPVAPAKPPAGAPATPQIYQDTLTATGKVYLNSLSVGTAGAAVGHENRQPYLTLVYAIATSGVYPPRP